MREMPYAEGRIYNDADSHFMETKTWLFEYADPKVRPKLLEIDFTMAGGQGTALSAVATLQAAVARYRQFIGDQPTRLAPVKPIVAPLPKTLPEAISISQIEHPSISASLHGVDAAQLQIKIAEGALYPSIGISASVTNQYDASGIPGFKVLSGQIMGNLTIPIYQAPAINGFNQGSTTLRNIPDVAAEANTDNFFCANGGCFVGVGGTSLSAPRRTSAFASLGRRRQARSMSDSRDASEGRCGKSSGSIGRVP